jgi:hypothetical protein
LFLLEFDANPEKCKQTTQQGKNFLVSSHIHIIIRQT